MSLSLPNDPRAHATLCREFTYRLVWRPERHYVAGTQVELRSHCLRAFSNWRYTGFRVSAGDLSFRWKSRPSVSDLRTNPQRVLCRARLPYGAALGEPVEFALTVVPPIWAGVNNVISVWTIDVANNFAPNDPAPAAAAEAGSACELVVAAGPVERLSVYAQPMPGPDGTVRTALVPEDRFGNPGGFARPLVATLTWNGVAQDVALTGPVTLQLPAPVGVQRARVSVPLAGFGPRENVANGTGTGDRREIVGNPVWPAPADGPRAAFGELHWHTDYSGDGQRPMATALHDARHALNLDFAAPADHNPRGERWAGTVAALAAANQPDAFATLFGWENASDRGHENYYFTTPDHPLVCGGGAGITGARPETLTARLSALQATHDFIGIPHHTNTVAEMRRQEDDSPMWHPYPWGEPQPYLRLVEIMQCRGNQEQENYDDAWRGWHAGHGASAQTALARGHRLGFVGGTDNHCGWPGRAFAGHEGGGIHPPKSVILTGVWTTRVERQAVYDALRARHTWAVWDTRALVDFRVNGAAAGDDLTVGPGTALVAHLRLSAEDALQTVEVVSDGRVVWQQAFAALDVTVDMPLGPAVRTTHFYLRALQRNGGLIYASPVFVGVA